MFILFITVLAVILFFIKIKSGSFFNPITIFSIFWIGVIFLSKFFSSTLYVVSNKTYNIVYLFVLSVTIGYFVFSKKFNVKNIKNNTLFFQKNEHKKVLIFFQICFLSILLYYLFKYNSVKKIIPLYQLRIVRYQIGLLFSSGLELLFYNYVIASFVELMGLLTIVKLVFLKKIDFLGILSIISLTIFSMIGLGRFGLFNAIFFIAATIFLKPISMFGNNEKKRKIKNWSKVLLPIFIFAILIYTMTFIGATRSGIKISSFSDFLVYFNASFEQAILYFTGPLRALDNFFLFKTNMYTNNLYGRAFFSGIDEFINFAFSNIGIGYESSNLIITNLTKETILIGDGVNFNAFYTGILNAYLDGKFIGIVFYSFISGLLVSLIWNLHLKYFNVYSFSLLVYSTLILVSSSYRLELQQVKTYIVVIVLLILTRKERKDL